MLEAFVSGFWQTVAWPAFGYMLLGIIIGFWVGLLPGIGGLSTLALMLPFSYSIKEPISAFAFLLGMLAVTGTTGDLTSILFGIPGEGSSAALILDGYPMSKNGEAGRALGAAITASLFGSVIGALSLALSIPIMRPLVLLFGSPELFIIAIMGITFIGTLAGAIADKRAVGRRHRSDARSHRRRPSDRILALHFRIPLLVGPPGYYSRGRWHVRHP